MATLAKLEISDGTTTVNLLTGTGQTGFSLRNWDPAVIQPKGGGVFQDSPMAPGRRLVYTVDATAIEDMTVDLNDYDQDGLIAQAQDLMRLLLKARAYQSTEFQDEPVWIRARSNCETNDRYALIINWSIPALSNPYAQPFVSATEISTMDEISLQLERGHWRANEPGAGECAEVNTLREWEYQAQWVATDVSPDTIHSFLEAANGSLYAGGDGQIRRSTDNGATWPVNTVLPAGSVWSLFQAANGYIFAGENGQITRTVDNGANWTVVTAAPVDNVNAFVEVGGWILAADQAGSIWRSNDNGDNWSNVALPIGSELARSMVVKNQVVYLVGNQYFEKSTDFGATWSIVSQIPSQTGIALWVLVVSADGVMWTGAIGAAGQLFKSIDDGLTWSFVRTFTGTGILSILPTPEGGFYLGTQGAGAAVWYSPDGYVWTSSVTTAAEPVYGLLRASEPAIYASGNTDILKLDLSTVETGTDDICGDVGYIGNRQNIANLTHIKIDDGGVFTDIFPLSGFPVTLYPANIDVNDALYFGSETAIINSGPFSGLVFDIDTIIPPAISRTFTWEYWNGAAWAALTNQDGTNIGAGSFGQSGVCSVHWVQPSDWAATVIDGVTAYWVRARLSAKDVGNISPPTQQNRQIYAVNSAFAEALDVIGDIPAIVQIKAHNRSDKDGPGGSGPDLFINRLIAGLRSFGDSSTFQAYLNISDEQNPGGVTITVGTNTTLGDDVTTPTGRRATYNPGGVEAMATRATVSLGPTIARDFYGLFHAFLRARRTAGASTDLSVRLQVATGSGGITFTTSSKQLQTTTAFEVLDFGEIALPVSGSFKSSDLADTTEIRIQASAASGTPDLYLYDLILIPVDEWAIDAVDAANESDSDVGRSGGIAKLLDVDSVTDPRIDIKTLVRTADAGGLITAEYNPITSGPAILQANTTQRLWFFAMRTSATGASYSWLAPPEIAHSVQVLKNEGYLGQRGAR